MSVENQTFSEMDQVAYSIAKRHSMIRIRLDGLSERDVYINTTSTMLTQAIENGQLQVQHASEQDGESVTVGAMYAELNELTGLPVIEQQGVPQHQQHPELVETAAAVGATLIGPMPQILINA